ncbi:MAG: response regulator transcription factor [Betaproteobacteria bacterium]|nr:MAG: response regulator transcription factor [Betaproteobacteria bacterium]
MTNETNSRGRKTVLIVEDQKLMRQTLRDFLRHAFPDCNLLEAADGASALLACKACRPVLVLMDKCLPDADGIDLTARFLSLYPGIQVMVISYQSGEVYVQRALAAGARAYLVKDNLSTELIPMVAAAIGLPPGLARGAS